MTGVNVGDEYKHVDETDSCFTNGRAYKVIDVFFDEVNFIDDEGDVHTITEEGLDKWFTKVIK